MSQTLRLVPDDVHNQTLLGNVHPPDWTNPTPSGRYNLVVLGAGTAGLVTAAGAAGLGAKVALIERERMGGDCLNVGCVPSKALIRSARAVAAVRDAAEFGVEVDGKPKANFPGIMARMRRLRAQISPLDSARRFQSLGVDVYLGEGRFTGPDTVEVGDRTLRFKKAVIATGARAAIPRIPGLEEVGYLSNETLFDLTELPSRLAVIGAGPIGCEMAQTFARFGSQVSLLELGPQILPREDREAAQIIESALVRDGVNLVCRCKIGRAESRGGAKVLYLDCNGSSKEMSVDEILVGIGRAPNVESLNLEAVGVEYDRRAGVAVDDRLQTTCSRIYAAGDVCTRFKFTHSADFMARIVIQNALFFGRAKASALVIPWCTFTSPEIAHVGLYPHEAKERGIEIETFVQELGEVDRAILDGADEGFVKVHVRKGTDKIIGGTVVAEHAGEMISELSLAMTAGLGLKAIGATIHPYPTVADAIRKTGDAYNRTRLTPRVKGLMKRFLAWRR